MSRDSDGTGSVVSPRVFISYAHDDDAHKQAVQDFWLFLRSVGVRAVLDVVAAQRPQDWPTWMAQQVRDADFVLVIASPAYKLRAEGHASPGEGAGVQWEARLIREAYYADHGAGAAKFLSVLLPGHTKKEIPDWLGPTTHTRYEISDYSQPGAEELLRYLTSQDRVAPELGPTPVYDRGWGPATGSASAQRDAAGSPLGLPRGLRTAVVLDCAVDAAGVLEVATRIGATPMGRAGGVVPPAVRRVWDGPHGGSSGVRLAEAGVALARLAFDENTIAVLAQLMGTLLPENGVDVVVCGHAAVHRLPWELLRLPATGDGAVGAAGSVPMCLVPGVTMARRLSGAPRTAPVALPGPVKILAAVAAPDKTRSRNAPLDVEAEMQTVLDATAGVGSAGQLQILEIADPPSISRAIKEASTTCGGFHVLHLSANGSAAGVELEDEDGRPLAVDAATLVESLRSAGAPVPLIVLSACGHRDEAAVESLAAALLAGGADRVLAMQTTVTDGYATALTRCLYEELVAHPDRPVSQAVARARQKLEQRRSAQARAQTRVGATAAGPGPAEWAAAALWCASGDAALVQADVATCPLPHPELPPTSRTVRELPLGALIGRRRQIRSTLAVLRADPRTRQDYGATGGVVLRGIGGIGKTAVAGRVLTRLRQQGWLIAVHDGLWNPAGLIAAVADALDTGQDPSAAATAAVLRSADREDRDQLRLITDTMAEHRLVLVFDDFEQNQPTGGGPIIDATLAEFLTATLTAAATAIDGCRVLMTSRYPIPRPAGLRLVDVAIGPLSPAELQRLLLRMPALNNLNEGQRRVLMNVVGGHPRLIEFVDAILRGGRGHLDQVTERLWQLADTHGVDLETPARDLDEATRAALTLGSADILFDDLLDLLTPLEREVLDQVATCHCQLEPVDVAHALTGTPHSAPAPELVRALHRLQDLTLLTPGPLIAMHPWTADLVQARTPDPAAAHSRAEAMHWARFNQGRDTFEDLQDLPRHIAALERFDDLAALANRVVRMLNGTAARLAYAGEIHQLIPPTQRAWILVGELTVQTHMAIGDLTSARSATSALHEAITARAAADPTNTEWQRDLSISHNNMGDLARAGGDLNAAATAYQAAADIRARLAAADPTNTGWQRDLSISHNNTGDLARAGGDLNAAATAYQAARDIRARLAAADPTNTGWQRDLSISHNKMGDLARASGDLNAATTAYQAAADIRARLAAADPTNTEWQRDLTVSHDRMGDLARAGGDLNAAATAHQAALDITARLAAADPTNTGWQRDLTVSHNKMGDLARASGDLNAATTAYQAAADIRARLAAADPTNTQWQRDLTVSHNKMGDLARASGDLNAAATAYQAAADITARLAAADPTNTQWQRDLSISHNNTGDLARASGDLTAAATAYQAAADITARLAAADPTNTQWQRDLSISHNNTGDLARAGGDLTAAATAYQAAADITARLAAADPTNTQWQRDLSISHERIGDLARAGGDLTAAATAYQAARDIRARLAAADPTNTQWQRDLSISHNNTGDLARAGGDLTAAATAYQAARDIRARLAAADPTNTQWQRDLSISHERIGDLARAGGDLNAAATAYQAARDIRARLAAADPTNTQWQRDLSISHERIGDLARAGGDLNAAATAYQAAADITDTS